MRTSFTQFIAGLLLVATTSAFGQAGSLTLGTTSAEDPISSQRSTVRSPETKEAQTGSRPSSGSPAKAQSPRVEGPVILQNPSPVGTTPEKDSQKPPADIKKRQSDSGAQPETPQSEFQRFVAASLGHSLPMFGYSLFSQVPSTFAQADRIPVTADYVVGPGDEILVRAWGQIDVDARVLVDRGGDIYLAKIGSLHVAGLKYSQLQDYIRTAVGRTFKNFDLTVNMGQLRSIQIFVVGHARRPGAYTVSSLSTLVNALFACGGPSPTGSMRHIQLKRDSRVVAEFDLYDLLLNGDKSKDVALLPGDVLFIPAVGPLVAMDGSVNVPAIYEIKGTETLGETLQLAGGLSNVADGQEATVERIEGKATRTVQQFPLDNRGRARSLQDGDVVRVRSMSPKFDNAVTLRGNVAKPGRYPWSAGMRVHDLLPTRTDVITREYWMRQNAAARDKEVRGMPEVNWGYALVNRMGADDLTNRLLPFNLGNAIDNPSSGDNLELQPGDIITVFSQADVRVSQAQQSKYVYLEGEFRTAGVYRAEPGETLRQLVERVGGLTPHAYLFGAQFTRESTRIEQQARLDAMMDQLQRDTQRNASLLAAKANSQDDNTLKTKLQTQQTMLDSMRQLTATGRIVLNLRPEHRDTKALPEIVLEDGDRFFVPAKSSSISVVGDVVNPGTFLHAPEKRIADYLSEAGGSTPFADPGRVFVLRADGSIADKKSSRKRWHCKFEDLQLMPGDAIVVPQRLPKMGVMSDLKEWAQILSQFGIAAAAVRVLSRP